MSFKQEIKCCDETSVFRIEDTGKVRLILLPEDRPILVGQVSQPERGGRVLLLYKREPRFDARSYTLACQAELLQIPGLRTIAIQVQSCNRFFCTSVENLRMYGYRDGQRHRQDYLFLDYPRWTPVGNLEDVMGFDQDHRAEALAQQGAV